MRYRYKTQQWIPYPTELVFAFFANPSNLPMLMLNWQRPRLEEARIVPPPPRPVTPEPAHRLRSVAAGKDSVITLSFRPFPLSPVRMPWESVITNFVWNESFTDSAVRSPFHMWEHIHNFTSETRANTAGIPILGTVVKDEVDYVPRGGDEWLGRRLHNQIIHPMMKRVFNERQRKLMLVLPAILGSMVPAPSHAAD